MCSEGDSFLVYLDPSGSSTHSLHIRLYLMFIVYPVCFIKATKCVFVGSGAPFEVE